jgi:hypothetical protein
LLGLKLGLCNIQCFLLAVEPGLGFAHTLLRELNIQFGEFNFLLECLILAVIFYLFQLLPDTF